MHARALIRHVTTDIRRNWRFGLAILLPPGLIGFELSTFSHLTTSDSTPVVLALAGTFLLWVSVSIVSAIAWHRRILLPETATTPWQAIQHPPLLRYLLGCLPVLAICIMIVGLANAVIQTAAFTYLSAPSTIAQLGFTLYILLSPVALPLAGAWLWCLLGAGLPAISLRRTGRSGQSYWRLMGAGLRRIAPISSAFLRVAIPMSLPLILLDRWQTVLLDRYEHGASNLALLWLSDGLSLAWSMTMTLITIALVTRIYDALTAQPR